MAKFPPWINDAGITAKGTGPRQQNSTEPAIDDLYKSPSVFVNGQPVVLYSEASSNGGSANISVAAALSIPEITPLAQPAEVGSTITVSGDKPASVALPSTDAPPATPPPGLVVQTNGDIKAFLDARLAEAQAWTRGQAPLGPGGNQNIVGIFKDLGCAAWAQTEATPWCAGFVNFVLKNCGYKYTQDLGVDALYDNPGKWGGTIKYKRGDPNYTNWQSATPGDVCIWDYGPKPPHHTSHTNFVYANLGSTLQFCGGNQGGKATNNNNPSNSSVTNGSKWSPSSDKPGSYSLMMIFAPKKR
jgi:hypothetical protein